MRRAALLVLLLGCASERATPPAAGPSVCGSDELSLDGACVAVGITECPFSRLDGRCTPQPSCAGSGIGCGSFDRCEDDSVVSALHVDALAALGGDGTRERPFRTIAEAVSAAAPHATVRIAPGRYRGSFTVDKPLRVIGRCARDVSIEGDDTLLAAVRIRANTHLEGVSITGPRAGVWAHNQPSVMVERVFVHDTGDFGIYASSDGPPSEVTVRHTVVERARGTGVNVSSATLRLEDSTVRDTRARSDRMTGYGVAAKHWTADGAPLPLKPKVTIVRSVIEHNDAANVVFSAADATILESVVRDPRARVSDRAFGACVQAQDEPGLDMTQLVVRSSVISGCRESGVIVVGSEALIEQTMIADVLGREGDSALGIGVSAQIDEDTRRPAKVTIRDSLVTDSRYVGVLGVGSELTIERSIIRRTALEEASGAFGDGVAVASWERGTLVEGVLTLRRSLLDENARAGVAVFGARATLADSALRCNGFDLNVERAYNAESFGGFAQRDFTLIDEGAVTCGCETTEPCRATSAALTPVRAK